MQDENFFNMDQNYQQDDDNLFQKLELVDDIKSNQEVFDYQQQFNSIDFNQNIVDLLSDQTVQQTQKIQYLTFLKNRIIEIQEPVLISDGLLSSYKLYTIKSRNKDSDQIDTTVQRRYNDFQYLQIRLIQNYGGCVIPILPQKNVLTSFNLESKQFSNIRKKMLERYLNSILDHKILRETIQIKNFLFFEEDKFFQEKGNYLNKVSTQQKIKCIVQETYKFGKAITNKIWGLENNSINQITILNKKKQDKLISEYQMIIQELLRVNSKLQKIVQIYTQQANIIYNLDKNFKGYQNHKKNKAIKIVQQFQKINLYIISCIEAISRWHKLAIQYEQLQQQQKKMLIKIKNNPRSYQLDILMSKINKIRNKLQQNTTQLIKQLSNSIQIGKSMTDQFIVHLIIFKNDLYNIDY